MLAAAATALTMAFPFQPVVAAPRAPALAVEGRTVFVRSPDGVKPLGAFAYPLDGGAPQPFQLTEHAQNLDLIEVTPQALTLQAADSPTWRVYYGPRNGPLRRLKKPVVDIGLSGSTMLSLEGAKPGREWILARDVNGGPGRRIARPGFDLRVMQAVGPYVSVENDKYGITVLNWKTKRVVYRVKPQGSNQYYALATGGRVVVISVSSGRVQTATPEQPRLREIYRAKGGVYSIATAGTRFVVQERRAPTEGRLVLIRPDRSHRAITPWMPVEGSDLAFDGTTVAFVSGPCVYAGPIPATTPTKPPPGC